MREVTPPGTYPTRFILAPPIFYTIFVIRDTDVITLNPLFSEIGWVKDELDSTPYPNLVTTPLIIDNLYRNAYTIEFFMTTIPNTIKKNVRIFN